MANASELVRVTRERDLYLRLLRLGEQSELEPFLREALTLVVEMVNALHGYLELHDDRGGPGWWIAHGLSPEQVDGVRHVISRGIIAEALATGRTIVTPSAMLDPRFDRLDSVRLSHIEAVLCTPIGDAPPRGVLYLQGQARPEFFSDEDRSCAETLAHHLAPLVDLVLARHRERTRVDPTADLRERLRPSDVVGCSPALAHVLRQVALAAPLDVTVLLTGESGTGKSQIARVIHENSPRAARPFVEVNCAALPENLIESELFGALPGAHSTATRRIEGKVAAAEGGTLFLDEIGELTSSAQAKLLQLLQSREYYPLGASKPVLADVRLIVASNTDLRQAVAERRFREDLLYRIQVLPIRMPTLAERREDIPTLANFFCARAYERYRLPRLALSPNALRAAESTDWPGNVRELAHAVEAAVIRAAGEHALQVERAHLFPEASGSPAGGPGDTLTFQAATRQFQADFLRRALEDNNWNVVETAKRLDLARSHVYNLIRAFGLERETK
ncbi:MAG TPA: sigma 54-interacting transcriptional regulator [Candidatus Limnocylindria bacterium]|nr:sigma 54-interacting transcriptional regulator [Candidatus Limnocylindria bacterium]